MECSDADWISGCIQSIRRKEYLDAALKSAQFIEEVFLKSDGSLFHNYAKGKTTINGFLEDYAAVIQAFISLYQVVFDEKLLELSRKLTGYVLKHFSVMKQVCFISHRMQIQG